MSSLPEIVAALAAEQATLVARIFSDGYGSESAMTQARDRRTLVVVTAAVDALTNVAFETCED